MRYLGDVIPGTVLDFNFATASDSATNGALAAAVSLAATVYKGNATTGVTTGVTVTANAYNLAQSNPHHCRIDTGAAATFYVGASDYQIVITGGTVGATSIVGYPIGVFSILNRSPLSNATTGRADVNTTLWGGSTLPTSFVANGGTIDLTKTVQTTSTLTGSVLLNATQPGVTFASLVVSAGTLTLNGGINGGLNGTTGASTSTGFVSGSVNGNIGGSVLGDVKGDVIGDLIGTATVEVSDTSRDSLVTAMWNRVKSTLTVPGSIGEWLAGLFQYNGGTADANAAATLAAATAAQANTSATGEIQTTLSTLVPGTLPGSRSVLFTVNDTAGSAIQLAQVKVIKNPATSCVFATGTAGTFTTPLEDITYSLVASAQNYVGTTSTYTVASNATACTMILTAFTIAGPSSPTDIRIWYYAKDQAGNLQNGQTGSWRITNEGGGISPIGSSALSQTVSAIDGIWYVDIEKIVGRVVTITDINGKQATVTIASDTPSTVQVFG